MLKKFFRVVMFGLLTAGQAPASETYVGSNADTRVLIGLAAPEAAAQAAMPDGWKILTLPRGPFAGSNVILSLVNRQLAWDEEGQPETVPTSRALVLLSFGIQPDAPPRVFLTHIYTTDSGSDPYGIARPAAISHVMSVGDTETGTRRRETWEVETGSGGSLRLELDHIAGIPVRSDGEILSYSAANPDFYRIYRYEQLDDVAMSEGLQRPLDGNVSLEVSIPELGALFDGTERIVTVISRPFYRRDIYLP